MKAYNKNNFVIRTLSTILPTSIKINLAPMVQWLWIDEGNFERQYKLSLETLRRGESTEPIFPGFEEEKQYIQTFILDYYGSFEGLTVLGAGCGTGRMEAWLASEGATVICQDNIWEALQISRIYAQHVHCEEELVLGDIERMPFKEKTFDVLNSGGVLEHFENLQHVLREYFRVTKPGGAIIASVPNLIGLNAGFGMKPITERVFRRGRRHGHIERDFSGREFKKILQESGFVCINISPTLFNIFDYFPFKYLRWVLSVLGVYNFYCKFLTRFGRKFPGIAFGYSFMIAFAQRPDDRNS